MMKAFRSMGVLMSFCRPRARSRILGWSRATDALRGSAISGPPRPSAGGWCISPGFARKVMIGLDVDERIVERALHPANSVLVRVRPGLGGDKNAADRAGWNDAHEIAHKLADAKIDRAGWHTTAKLEVPANITPIFLPSRAPELNPVENVWEFLRSNWLSNLVFDTYDEMLDAACDAWRNLEADPGRKSPQLACESGRISVTPMTLA